MTVKIYIPRDAAALALGADKVAKAIAQQVANRGLEAQIVRNGSRGTVLAGADGRGRSRRQGRIGYGPVKANGRF